jgi:hypothetical protein
MIEEGGTSRSEKVSTAVAIGLTFLMPLEAIALLFTSSDGS